jgi:hypothetical protein
MWPLLASSGGISHLNRAPSASGRSLQPSDDAPVICDPGASGFRFVEVRGTGFNAWATQRLVGNLVDDSGTPRMQWGSVWVSAQGRLTLEVNLCADPFRGRGALAVGTYTVAVGPGSGAAIAAANIELSPQPEPPTEGDQPLPQVMPPATSPETANPVVPAPVVVLPNQPTLPTPTPLPAVTLPVFAPSPTPTPRTGPGDGVFSAMRLAPYAFPKKERPLTQPVAKKLRPIGQPRRIARE